MVGLKNKAAVVTGASGGIGRCIAHALAARGVNLCLLGRSESRLEQVSTQLKKVHPVIETVVCDLSSVKSIYTAVEKTKRILPDIDILVHSAGNILVRSLEETTVAEFDQLYHVNTRAPFILTKLLLPSVKRKKGQIVFLNSSVAQQKSREKLSAYTSGKVALQAIADSLRDEVNASEVRVISVFPGRTATEMQEEIFRSEGRQYQKEMLLQPEDVAQSVIDALVLPGTAEVTDVSIRPFRKI